MQCCQAVRKRKQVATMVVASFEKNWSQGRKELEQVAMMTVASMDRRNLHCQRWWEGTRGHLCWKDMQTDRRSFQREEGGR